MALSPAEKTARYNARKYAEYDAMPKIECTCGCGTLIAPINRRHEPARFAHGHNPDGESTRFQPGDVEHAKAGAEARRAAGKLEREGHHRWNGGEWPVKGGYMRRTITPAEAAWMPTALRHGNGWSIQRSHYVWNKAHPTDVVQQGEVVHHVNRVRDDDRVENFEKMARGAHQSMHRRAARRA